MKSWMVLSLVLLLNSLAQQTRAPLELVASIPLPRVQGRIDHMAYDSKNQRLFMAALENNTLEVINLKTQAVRSLSGFSEPQGVVWIPSISQLFVTNGGDGTAVFLDGNSLEVVRRINIGEDPDNVRYDPEGKRLFVGYGSAIVVLDLTGRKLSNISLAAHPESFQLETDSSGQVLRIFVNLPGAIQIAVVDPARASTVVSWRVSFRSNFPMALDTSSHRLFVATRNPSRLLILDSQTGREITNLQTVGDADDVFFDAQRKRVYVSGGEGAVTIYQQNIDHFDLLNQVSTSLGARTSFWDGSSRLFVAAPKQVSQEARLLVYEVRN